MNTDMSKKGVEMAVPDAAYLDITQSLVSPADTAIPSSKSTEMIQVTAPATLPEDYIFDAQLDDRVFSVKVPHGGVVEGQKFSAPLPTSAVSNGDEALQAPRASAPPMGRFRDGLCDCFHYGLIHPMLWNSYYFPAIALGQVMTRLRLNWIGKLGSADEAAKTFKVTLGLTVSYYVLRTLLIWIAISFSMNAIATRNDDKSNTSAGYNVSNFVWHLVALCYWIYIGIAAMRTRSFIRTKYNIPAHNCGDLEDCCCSFCCTCCSISQMGRHTADYDIYASQCCSTTGIPPNCNVPGLDDSSGKATNPVMAEII